MEWFSNHPYVSAYLVGCVYYGLTVSWMFGLRTAEIATGVAFYVVSISAALVMVSSFSLGLVFFVWLYRRLDLSLADPKWWLIPAAWIVSEYLRAVFFSIVSMGPGGRIGPYWTFGNVGYWLVHTPFVYAARWGGLYLLSLIVVACVVGLIRAFLTRKLIPLAVPLIVSALLSVSGWLVYRTSTGPTRQLGVVQFANEFSPENFSSSANEELAKRPAQSYDALLLPEYSHLWERSAARDTEAISRVLKDPRGLVIDSAPEVQTEAKPGHNLVTYHSGDGTPLFSQQKWFSIPGGEYVPYLYQVILAYAGQEQMLLHFNDQKSIDHGEVPERPFLYDDVSWGAMACSGVVAPELYRGMTVRGATVLTNSASLDTMGLGMAYHYQARDMAVLHAVANARPFAQSARGGLSYIIDQNGHYVAQTHERGYDFLEGTIQMNKAKTLYTAWGDWVVWISVSIVLGAWLTSLAPMRKYWVRHSRKQ